MTLKAAVWTLIIVTAIIYFNSLWNPFIWDDEQFIQKNVYIQQIQYWPLLFTTNTIAGAGHVSNYYRPLTSLSFGLDYQFWGLNPTGFHLTNTSLHILAGIGLLLFLRSLKLKPTLALWLSLIFLVHPVQTEAITYINSRGDSLYAGLLVWSLYLWSLAIQKQSLIFYKLKLTPNILYLLTIMIFLGSLLSKEIALAGLPLYMLVFWRHYWPQKLPLVKSTMTFSLLAIGLITVGYFSLRLTVLNFQDILNYQAADNLYTDSLLVRLLTFSKVCLTYISILVWPYPLHMERNSEIISQIINPWTMGLISGGVGILIAAYYEWRKYQTAWLMFGMIWSTSLLIPTTGIIPINGLIYEHWLYLPMVGFWLIIWRLLSFIKLNLPTKVINSVLVLVISAFSVLTIYQNYLWSSAIIFYEYTLKFSQTARLHNNLAMAYSDQKNYPQAEANYLDAVAITDQYPQTYFNLGNLYLDQQKYEQAEQSYLKSLTVDPNFYFVYPRLINLYYQTKQYDKALPYLDLAVKNNPNDYQIEIVYGQVLLKLNQPIPAQDHFNQALRLTHNHPQVAADIQSVIEANRR